MENIKPEDILRNHKNGSDVHLTNYISEDGFVWKSIVNCMREYAQIACSTLSEEIRIKDERISELEEHNIKLMDGIVIMNAGINYLFTGNEYQAEVKFREAAKLLKSLKP